MVLLPWLKQPLHPCAMQLSGPLDPKSDARKRALRVVRDALKAQQQGAGVQQSAASEPVRGLGPLGPLGPLGLGGAPLRAVGSGPTPGGRAVSGVSVSPEAMETLMNVLSCEEAVDLLEWEQVARHAANQKW